MDDLDDIDIAEHERRVMELCKPKGGAVASQTPVLGISQKRHLQTEIAELNRKLTNRRLSPREVGVLSCLKETLQGKVEQRIYAMAESEFAALRADVEQTVEQYFDLKAKLRQRRKQIAAERKKLDALNEQIYAMNAQIAKHKTLELDRQLKAAGLITAKRS